MGKVTEERVFNDKMLGHKEQCVKCGRLVQFWAYYCNQVVCNNCAGGMTKTDVNWSKKPMWAGNFVKRKHNLSTSPSLCRLYGLLMTKNENEPVTKDEINEIFTGICSKHTKQLYFAQLMVLAIDKNADFIEYAGSDSVKINEKFKKLEYITFWTLMRNLNKYGCRNAENIVKNIYVKRSGRKYEA